MADLTSNNVVTSRRISSIINGIWSKISGKYATSEALESENLRATGVENDLNAAISQNSEALSSLQALIPDAASTANKLADKAYVDFGMEQVAAKYLSSDEYGHPFTSHAAFVAGPYYYAGEVVTPTKNDYVLINGDESVPEEEWTSDLPPITRYWYTGSSWAFQYIVNNSPLNEAQLDALNSGITSENVDTYDNHIGDKSNPHEVTKAQIGLGNVDNTSDANKPISTATQNALNGKQDTISDLNEIRDGAAAGATAVQPSAISDMETRAHAAATYQSKGNYLTEEEDPVFSSSPASGITSSDIESWNAKQNAIGDLNTIRNNAANGNTAYGWGNHANAGYIDGVDSDSTTVFTDSTTIVVGKKSGSKLLVRTATTLWTYIKGKADAVYSALGHTHTKSDITDFPTSLPAAGGDAYRLYCKRNAMPDGTAITNLNNFYQLGKVMFGEFQGSSVSNCPVDNWVLVESRCGNDTTVYVTQIATRMTGNMSGTTAIAANGDMWVRTCNGGMWTSWVKYVKPSDITTNGRIFYRSLSQLSLAAPVAYHQVLEAMPNNSELVMWNNSSTFTDYPSTVVAGIIHFIRGADLGAANIEAFGRNYGDHYVAKITSSASSTTCTVDAWYKMSKDGHSHGQITGTGAIYPAGQVDIANGDRLVIIDASDNSLLKRSSNTFDGSTVSQYLSRKGTFEDMPTELPAAGGAADTIKIESFSQAGVNLDTILGENYRVKWYRWASDKKPSGITYTGCLEVVRHDNLIVQNMYYLNQPGYHMARYYVDGVWQSWIKVIDKPTASDVGALAANGKAADSAKADAATTLSNRLRYENGSGEKVILLYGITKINGGKEFFFKTRDPGDYNYYGFLKLKSFSNGATLSLLTSSISRSVAIGPDKVKFHYVETGSGSSRKVDIYASIKSWSTIDIVPATDVDGITVVNQVVTALPTDAVESSYREIAYTDSDITGNAATATKADTARVAFMLGSNNVGNVSTPIYLYQGVPNPCLTVAADTVDGYHIVVGSVGDAANTIYFA